MTNFLRRRTEEDRLEDQSRPPEWRLELREKNHPSPRQVAKLGCSITTHVAGCIEDRICPSCLAADIERILAALANGSAAHCRGQPWWTTEFARVRKARVSPIENRCRRDA